MKINAQNDSLIIENSLAANVTVGILVAIGGVGAMVYGLTSHKNTVLIAGVIAIGVSVLTFIFSKGSKITLSKSGPSSVSAKRLFGGAVAENFQLTDVTIVELDTRPVSQVDSNSSVPNARTQESTINLLTKTGQRIQVGRGTHSVSVDGTIGNLVQDAPLKKEADAIANFIGVPVSVTGSPNLKEVVNQVKTMMGGVEGDVPAPAATSPAKPPAPAQITPAPATPQADTPSEVASKIQTGP